MNAYDLAGSSVEREKRTCITTRRSALPVRISYKMKVRSEPTVARMDGSERLNLIADTVSFDVGKVIFDIGVLLQ